MNIFTRILKEFFDYRYVYLFVQKSRYPGRKRVKIGISTNWERRLSNIKKSTKNKRIEPVGAARVLFARRLEAKFRKEYIGTRFNYKGSGKTEWHKLKRAELFFLKNRLILISIKDHLVLFSSAILIFVAIFKSFIFF